MWGGNKGIKVSWWESNRGGFFQLGGGNKHIFGWWGKSPHPPIYIYIYKYI